MQIEQTTPLSVRRYDASPGSHVHEHFQILWGLSGALEIEVDGCATQLSAGQGLVISPGSRHDFESRQGSLCLVLDTTDAVWNSHPDKPLRPGAVERLACYLVSAIELGLPIARQLGPLLLAEAWAQPQPALRPRREIDWQALSRWVLGRLAQPLSIADLAAWACLSETQFREHCHQALGCSPMQWIRAMRLAKAQQLRDRGFSVADAARMTGYQSPSALTAAMRRQRAS